MLAYQDTLSATQRNEYLGALADLIAQSYSPQRTQQMQGTARFLSMPAISQTLDRLSYGEPLTTGAGMTTRIRPEALEAAIAVAPAAQPVTMATLQAARAARQAALQAGRAGERYAEKVVPGIMERGGLPAEMLQGMANRTISPLDVYHGTPHRFAPTARNPLGEFDASKIGTGEGAQVYGHGLYVAEAPKVAKRYQETLAGKAFSLKPEAERLGIDLPISTRGEFMRQAQAKLPPEKLAKNLQNANIAARDLPQNKLAELFKAYQEKSGGNLYKVDLPDKKIATMLDWDAPLSKQPDAVQRWLKDAYNPYKGQLTAKDVGGNEPTGSLIYNRLKELMSEGKKSDVFTNQANFGAVNASKELADFGISGIKYLDQQSQTAGKGTRNFVVFPGEEKSMTILERQGK
jgi:hypothetical protein